MQQIVTKKIRCKSSQAFTLIELLIVIFLISLLYGLAFGYFVNPEKKAGDILSLKEDILRASHDAKRLVCTNECSECFIVSHAGLAAYPNKSQKFDSLEDAQKAWLLGVSETRSEGIR
ncbi:MAG: type II secretion system protein [Sulfurovaceae bacterium]